MYPKGIHFRILEVAKGLKTFQLTDKGNGYSYGFYDLETGAQLDSNGEVLPPGTKLPEDLLRLVREYGPTTFSVPMWRRGLSPSSLIGVVSEEGCSLVQAHLCLCDSFEGRMSLIKDVLNFIFGKINDSLTTYNRNNLS